MKYRSLGRTGLTVSEIALGTVELGMDYGFRGSTHYQRPSRQEAGRIVNHAVESAINLIDTARAYGDSEEIIGDALTMISRPPYTASKVMVLAPDQRPTDSGKAHANS